MIVRKMDSFVLSPGDIHSGITIVHFSLFFKLIASHKGTSTGTYGSNGPNSPCVMEEEKKNKSMEDEVRNERECQQNENQNFYRNES
jgi:hypothetical protein